MYKYTYLLYLYQTSNIFIRIQTVGETNSNLDINRSAIFVQQQQTKTTKTFSEWLINYH